MLKELRIGFDKAVSHSDALQASAEEFAEAASRENRTVIGIANYSIISDDPVHEALGEYLVHVSGEWSDGD